MNDHLDVPGVRLICSKETWVEGDAVRQLHQAAALDGMVSVVGLPDIHPGKCSPVGAAFLSRGIIYPALIGNDVGCGIGLFATDLKKKKNKKDKWIKRLDDLELPFDGRLEPWLRDFGLEAGPHDAAMGTIGGGNHFAELQSVDKVFDQAAFDTLGLDKRLLVTLVHSGSRSLGDGLFRRHAEQFGNKGLDDPTVEADCYLAGHDQALKWAACSRALIAHRFGLCINTECRPVVDVPHNCIEVRTDGGGRLFLHRKGAAASASGFVVIPGSRGSFSYLVKARGPQEENLWSLPHGAGRKWSRGSCKEKLKGRYPARSLVQTAMGGHVICEDKDLLYEEAPQAYKNIDTVIADLTGAGLIDVVAAFRPLITYKMRRR